LKGLARASIGLEGAGSGLEGLARACKGFSFVGVWGLERLGKKNFLGLDESKYMKILIKFFDFF
jgi:hypothetical protein